jgi:hypothetical protein
MMELNSFQFFIHSFHFFSNFNYLQNQQWRNLLFQTELRFMSFAKLAKLHIFSMNYDCNCYTETVNVSFSSKFIEFSFGWKISKSFNYNCTWRMKYIVELKSNYVVFNCRLLRQKCASLQNFQQMRYRTFLETSSLSISTLSMPIATYFLKFPI